MYVKRIGVGAAIVGALGFAAIGMGSGVANAEQPVPNSPGITWKPEKPHWDNWYDDDRGRRWNGGGYYGGPQYGGPCVWVPPAVSVWVPPAVC